MKHDELRSIAHNLADSFMCGNGFLIGLYHIYLYDEVEKSAEGFITVDFLKGTTMGAQPSQSLARAVELYRDALPELCARHGASALEFAELSVRYFSAQGQKGFSVTITDLTGRQTTTDYEGIDSHRVKVLDGKGRIRPKPVQRLS
jgi:hypothetical protein